MVEVRQGRMRLQRLGALNAVRQRRGSRAPARHGVWAFPWPFFDMYYAAHKFETAMPKALRQDRGFDDLVTLPEDRRPQTSEEWSAYWEARERWVREHRRQVMPIREFWWDAPVYTHLNRAGEYVGMGDWELLGVVELERAIRRHVAGVGRHRFRARNYEMGVFEVFAPMRRGGRDRRR